MENYTIVDRYQKLCAETRKLSTEVKHLAKKHHTWGYIRTNPSGRQLNASYENNLIEINAPCPVCSMCQEDAANARQNAADGQTAKAPSINHTSSATNFIPATRPHP